MAFFEIVLRETSTSTLSLKDFERHLDALDKKVFPKALNRTANRIGVAAKNEAQRALVKDMGIKKKNIKPDFFAIDKSTLREQNFSYTWRGSSFPLPLSYFKGKGLKHGSRLGKKGYAATTFGKRRKYKFFEAKMKSGHVGAFYRTEGSWWHKSKQNGKAGTYPIKEAFGPSITVGMERDVVRRAFERMTSEAKVMKELKTNIRFYASKLAKSGR